MKDFELRVGDVIEVGDIMITVLEIHNGQVDLRIDDELYSISASQDDHSLLHWN